MDSEIKVDDQRLKEFDIDQKLPKDYMGFWN